MDEQKSTVNNSKLFKFTEEQRLVMRDFYAKNQYPNEQEKENFSNQFGCTKKQINTWFTYTRQVIRKRNSSIPSKEHTVSLWARSFTSLKTDLYQDINRDFVFSRCFYGTFP